MLLFALAPPADAFPVPSAPLGSPSPERIRDVERLKAFFERKAVEKRLLDIGFTTREVESRLSCLDDRQIRDLAQRTEDLKVGSGGQGVLIGIAIILLVILVILPLLGIRVWR